MRQMFSNLSPETKKQIQRVVPAAINLITSIPMLVIGSIYASECKIEWPTLFLKVSGSYLLITNVMKLVTYFLPYEQCNEKIANIITPLFDLGYLGPVIWGSVKVFGSYGIWTSEHQNSPNYCPNVPYNMSFTTLIVFWIMFTSIAGGSIVAGIVKKRANK